MYNLEIFRAQVQELLRRTTLEGGGRASLAGLATEVGLSRTELSRRLHGKVPLSARDVRAIVRTLTLWGALYSRAEAEELLALVSCPSFTASEWATPPLDLLTLTLKQEAATYTPPHHNLPIPLTSCIGRGPERASTTQMLASHRLVTISGPGGAGKTRLALEVARELLPHFKDGVWLVELASLGDPQLVLPGIAAVLGISSGAGQPLLDTIIHVLQAKELLLLLDNCEHLVGEAAEVAHALLSACPQLWMLATSRERLWVGGEAVLGLAGLGLSDGAKEQSVRQLAHAPAVQLFIARAAEVRPRIRLTRANAEMIASLCQHLDGLPLALELAAAHLRVMTINELSQHLERYGRLGGSGRRDRPTRHQSLEQVIDWSYQLLSPAEQRLFRGLSAFVGGFSIGATEAVFAEEGADKTVNLVEGLLDKSLVQREDDPSSDATRLRMLETIREYGLRQLAVAGEEQEVRHRHLMYYLRLADEVAPRRPRLEGNIWRRELERELGNMRAALSFAMASGKCATALQMATSLHYFWLRSGRAAEGRTVIEQALALGGMVAPTLKARAQYVVGELCWQLADVPAARHFHEQSLACWRELGERREVARTMGYLVLELIAADEYPAARHSAEESLAIYRELGDNEGMAQSLTSLGDITLFQGEAEAARQLYEESWALSRNLPNPTVLARTLSKLGNMDLVAGKHNEAISWYEQSLGLYQQMDSIGGSASLNSVLARALLASGDMEGAKHRFLESLLLFQQIGNDFGVLNSLDGLVGVAGASGEVRYAVRLGTVVAERYSGYKVVNELEVLSPYYTKVLLKAEALLSEDGFKQLQADGKRMSLDEAARFALGGTAG